MQRPKFRMPFSPYSGYATLVFLVAVLILMYFDKVQGPWMVGAIVVGIPALIGGWYLVRGRVTAAAQGVGANSEDVSPTPVVDLED